MERPHNPDDKYFIFSRPGYRKKKRTHINLAEHSANAGPSATKRKRDDSTPYRITTRRLDDGRRVEIVDLTTPSPPRARSTQAHGLPSGLESIEERKMAEALAPMPPAPRSRQAPVAAAPPAPYRSLVGKEVHALIDSIQMPPTHRVILKWISYIPYGSWSSYCHLRDWIKQYTDNPSGVRSIPTALRNSYTIYGFELDEVPVHRFIQSGGGTTDWGTWLRDHVDDDQRRRMLEREGCRFDKNGRILGGALFLRHGHELEDLIGSNWGLSAEDRRVAAARRVCDAARLDGSNPLITPEWRALIPGDRAQLYMEGYIWVKRFDPVAQADQRAAERGAARLEQLLGLGSMLRRNGQV